MFITHMHAKNMGVCFYLMVPAVGEGEGVVAGVWLKFQNFSSQARLLLSTALCGFEGDEDDQQNDPTHQRDDVKHLGRP